MHFSCILWVLAIKNWPKHLILAILLLVEFVWLWKYEDQKDNLICYKMSTVTPPPPFDCRIFLLEKIPCDSRIYRLDLMGFSAVKRRLRRAENEIPCDSRIYYPQCDSRMGGGDYCRLWGILNFDVNVSKKSND